MTRETKNFLSQEQALRVLELWARYEGSRGEVRLEDVAEGLSISVEDAASLLSEVRSRSRPKPCLPELHARHPHPWALWGVMAAATAVFWTIGLRPSQRIVSGPSMVPSQVQWKRPEPGSLPPAPSPGPASVVVEWPVPPPPAHFPVRVFQGERSWVCIPLDNDPRPLPDRVAMARLERTHAALMACILSTSRVPAGTTLQTESHRRARAEVAVERRHQEESASLRLADGLRRHMPPAGVSVSMLGRLRGGGIGGPLKLVPVNASAARAKTKAFLLEWLREDYLRTSRAYESGPLPKERDLKHGYEAKIKVADDEREVRIPAEDVRNLAKSKEPPPGLLRSIAPLLDFVEAKMRALSRGVPPPPTDPTAPQHD